MFKTELLVDDDILQTISDTAQQSPKLMRTNFNRAVKGIRRKARTMFRQTPGAPSYPINWKRSARPANRAPNMSDGTYSKQKAAFFATDGFGKGIPTRRNNKMVDAWEVIFTGQGMSGVFEITNNIPYEKYVTGADQQPFHRDTGWYRSEDKIIDLSIEAEERLIQTWFTVADPFAGVTR